MKNIYLIAINVLYFSWNYPFGPNLYPYLINTPGIVAIISSAAAKGGEGAPLPSHGLVHP